MDMRQGGAIKYAVFCGQTITGLCRTQKMHSNQMLKELIEEAGRWDLEQKTGKSVDVKHLCERITRRRR